MTDGAAEIGFREIAGKTRLDHLYQRDPLRVLFPNPAAGDAALAVLVTTSGGLVGGDRLDIAVRLAPGAAAHITASAAEKIYRSAGRTTVIAQSLSIGAAAALEVLPPETILFEGAAFLGGDIVVFGRRARGERFTSGFFREVWEVRRDGALLWGDALHLEDDVGRIVDDPACFDGAAGFATMILACRQDPRDMLGLARAAQSAGEAPGLRAGATAVAGVVVARWLAADAALLRRAYADLACHFRSTALGLPPNLPRIWHV